MSDEKILLLPGEQVPPEAIPTHKKKHLGLGPGIRLAAPQSQSLVATTPGLLVTNRKKHTISLETNGGKYIPKVGDIVIAQIHHTSGDNHYVSLSPHTAHALLPVLSFESASKKNKPNLNPGSLVLARVSSADKHMDPELECVNAETGKADELGPLETKGCGMVVNVSLGFARRLLMPRSEDSGVVVLEELGKAKRDGGPEMGFEAATGRNGKVWIESKEGDVGAVVAVCRALRETDERGLDVAAQRKLVRRIVKDVR